MPFNWKSEVNFCSIRHKLNTYIGLCFDGRRWYSDVYFSGLEAKVYWLLFSLTFRLHLWPASSEDWLLCCCSESTGRSLLTSLYTGAVMSSRAWRFVSQRPMRNQLPPTWWNHSTCIQRCKQRTSSRLRATAQKIL